MVRIIQLELDMMEAQAVEHLSVTWVLLFKYLFTED